MLYSIEKAGFFCPNNGCPDYGKKGMGNVIVYNRYGRDNRRLLKCKTCNFRFSERRNTFFFGLHTHEAKIREVILYLLDGKSFREAALSAGIDKDTVLRIWKRFVAYCEECMEDLLTEFNMKLEDLIVLLYQRKGLSRKLTQKEPGSLWEKLCGNGKAGAEGLCSGHE